MDRAQRASWQSGHKALRKGRASAPSGIYLLTATTSGRKPLFANFRFACIVASCFEQPLSLGTNRLLAWVLMPDHAHWLLELGKGERLETSVGRLKAVSARQLNDWRMAHGAVWAAAFHDHALRREEDLLPTARYIIANPVRAGLTRRVGDYPFWNAVWL